MNYQPNPYPSQGYMKYQPYQPLQQQAVPVPTVQPYAPVQQWQQPVDQQMQAPQAVQPPQEAAIPVSNDALAQAINRLCDLTEALYSDYRKEIQKIWTSDR